MIILDYTTLLRTYGGKNLPLADFAFMSLDIDELCTDNALIFYSSLSHPLRHRDPR